MNDSTEEYYLGRVDLDSSEDDFADVYLNHDCILQSCEHFRCKICRICPLCYKDLADTGECAL